MTTDVDYYVRTDEERAAQLAVSILVKGLELLLPFGHQPLPKAVAKALAKAVAKAVAQTVLKAVPKAVGKAVPRGCTESCAESYAQGCAHTAMAEAVPQAESGAVPKQNIDDPIRESSSTMANAGARRHEN